MRVYFLSERKSALFLNGLYLGMVDLFERSVELDPADKIFCELRAPLCAPLSFVLDEAFLFSPPPFAELYFSGGSVAVYCRDFLRADSSLSVLKRETVNGIRCTLYLQGRLFLQTEQGGSLHTLPLPDSFSECELHPCGDGVLLQASDRFLLLSREGDVLVRADGVVKDVGETLTAEVNFHDSIGHTALCEWRGGELLSCTIRTAREPTASTFALALFESALLGADCSPYLADGLLPKAGELKSFLGDFVHVVMTADPAVVGLVYGRKERVFDVRYYRVTLQANKISNIAEI